ncbi:MAG: Subtilisin-like serine protease [Ignavibacteria bacterium]|nr:Subtilisin-like serine protease [Ignavibacteria bacterium]
MKISYPKYLIISIIVYILIFAKSFSQSIEPQMVILKFRENSSLAKKWSSGLRNINIEDLLFLLGEHHSEPYISDELLKSVQKYFQYNEPTSITNEPNQIVNNLSRICVIHYTKNIDPKIVARKLSSNPDIEYAEPAPKHFLLSDPNDTYFSEQYYLQKIRVIEAWDSLKSSGEILVGIIDTGVDYLHEDLAPNIYINPGESGTDANGKEKKSNGIDDDNNGFIDDWHGWDFASKDSINGQDNNPAPGNPHGTHLSGTVAAVTNNNKGIAGVALNTKILPVKVGDDDPNGKSVSNAYPGILYAATMGAKVINCSWGGSSKSQAEQDVITTVLNLGSVVIAAAGNSSDQSTIYPGGYNGALSVGATNQLDQRAYFSNYGNIGVTAPGVNIFATIPGSDYQSMDGTSMSTPVTSGVASLVRQQFPNFTPLQVIEQIKATADNIDSLNPFFAKKLGKGRINALRAITERNTKSLLIIDKKIIDEDNDNALNGDEKVTISLNIKNVLSPLKKVWVKIKSNSSIKPLFTKDSLWLGDLATGQEVLNNTAFLFTVPNWSTVDYPLTLEIDFVDEDGWTTYELLNLLLKPSYLTLKENNIAVTVNSRGNYAFDDYSDNLRGDGFKYKNSPSVLFEGALMIASSPAKISNCARGVFEGTEDDGFTARTNITKKQLNSIMTTAVAEFFDKHDNTAVGVDVIQTVYQNKRADKNDYIVIDYMLKNTSGKDIDTIYTGMYFDWDIGPNGAKDKVVFDDEGKFGYAYNTVDDSLPKIGVALLSNQKLNYFAIDNDGTGGANPGVYGGYSWDEKWQTLSSGIGRKESNITDASQVISAGPFSLKDKDTTHVKFIIGSSLSLKTLKDIIEFAKDATIDYVPEESKQYDDLFMEIFPNPAVADFVTISYSTQKAGVVQLEVYDLLGRKLSENKLESHGIGSKSSFRLPIVNYQSGKYVIVLKEGLNSKAVTMSILK